MYCCNKEQSEIQTTFGSNQEDLVKQAIDHCGKNNIDEARQLLVTAISLPVESMKPHYTNGMINNLESSLKDELLVSPQHVKALCQTATFFSFFLSEYQQGKTIFSKIFTEQTLEAIFQNKCAENFSFLEEQALNYAELLCFREAEDVEINHEISNFIAKQYEKNPTNFQYKKLYAKILIDKFVQSTKKLEENEDYNSELLEKFGIGVRLMIVRFRYFYKNI